MDGIPNLAVHGLRAVHVCADWNGDWPRTWRRAPGEISALGADHSRLRAVCSKFDQRRRGLDRHGRCRRDADRTKLPCFGVALRNRHRLGHDPVPLLSNRDDLEMARALSLCLCHHRVCGEARLEAGPARYVPAFLAERTRRLAESRGPARHNDQPLSILLAILE